jgi:dynein heavy chain
VSLPHENITFTLENFVSMQEEYINDKRNLLTSKNVEVERAVDDLIQTILNYPLDVRIDPVKSDETKRIKKFYFWYLYQALLNATQNSLNAMKYRVCGNKGQSQQLSPFFEVDVQLSGSEVRLNPSLEEIQKAINKAATAVLRCSKKLYNWDQQNTEDGKKQSLYEMIAQDREIVKVILLLTGSIQGTKNKVIEFMSKFSKYDWLWKNSISKSIKEFSKGSEKPQLQAYEDELKKFTLTEEDIEKIEPTFIIGAMKLKTQNLCNGLKAHCKEWKNQYSEDLHKKARVELDKLTENIKELSEKLLKTEVKDIDSLGIVMEKL